MDKDRFGVGKASENTPNLDELARQQHAEPVEAVELACDIWESDEELNDFMIDLRTSRDASMS